MPADDYLSVNVLTPAEDGERLPVLVWVHGGGFVAGTSADPSFEPSTLARQARVVVVSMNYRVGVEGFGLIEGAPPNRGLLDVVAALEWAEANVAAFGGDPGNLTVYGQSAGAGTVAALLSMPANERFWSRAILSSVPCVYFTPALAASCGEKIAAAAGVANTVEEMAGWRPTPWSGRWTRWPGNSPVSVRGGGPPTGR
ncbi:carboxylesterase family protein [Streptomyces albidoflavus]|uniref:carboxylesterase family protein n=1 Tax=Streptomyces albidoflavus TaxID=1886 RepID=UPI0033C5DE87